MGGTLACWQTEQPIPRVESYSYSYGQYSASKAHEDPEKAYKIGAVLGKGYFGTVYAATRKKDRKPVAMKTIPKENIKRWATIGETTVPLEICLLSRAQHVRGVIKMIEFYERACCFVVVMERPEGAITLAKYVKQNGTLSEHKARSCYRQLIVTVGQIHRAGVMHGDIKTENILVDKEKRLKLIDFGCSDILTDGMYYKFRGTRRYRPPEWLEDKKYEGVANTVWSLGILLYNMVTGDVPFHSAQDILDDVVVFDIAISKDLRDLILLCLKRDPYQRPTIRQILKHPWMKSKRHQPR